MSARQKVLTHFDSQRAMTNKLAKLDRKTSTSPSETYLDWDDAELEVALKRGLAYTIRSSKYPRTLKNPARITLTLNSTHTWSLHKVLLTTLTKTLAAPLLSNPHLHHLDISAIAPISNPSAWSIFLTWLYTFDKSPLQDYTPLRDPSWQTSSIKDAAFLSSFLGAPKFEKYLLRIIYKEIWDSTTPSLLDPHPQPIWSKSDLRHLGQCMGKTTGLWHFLKAYHRWDDAGRPGHLDPYTWRVEHWYAICGTTLNWGCFHAMNESGWGGVWERQRGRWGSEVKVVKGVKGGEGEEENWLDEVVYDDPAEGDCFWGNDVSKDMGLGVGVEELYVDGFYDEDVGGFEEEEEEEVENGWEDDSTPLLGFDDADEGAWGIVDEIEEVDYMV